MQNRSRLRRLREDAGYTLRQAARAVGVKRRDLAAYERGLAAPTEVRRRLAALYDVPAGALVPQRKLSAVVLEGPAVRIGKASQPLAAYNPGARDVLDGYVALVNQLRGLQPGDPFPLREADVEHLAQALGSDAETIEQRLMDLVHCNREEARHIRTLIARRRVLMPAAGMAMGAALIGMPRLDLSPLRPTTEVAPVSQQGMTVATPPPEPAGPADYPLIGAASGLTAELGTTLLVPSEASDHVGTGTTLAGSAGAIGGDAGSETGGEAGGATTTTEPGQHPTAPASQDPQPETSSTEPQENPAAEAEPSDDDGSSGGTSTSGGDTSSQSGGSTPSSDEPDPPADGSDDDRGNGLIVVKGW